MKFYLKTLILKLKRSEEVIEFSDVSYFYGKMGAGKTSIARLIDYCLGGEFEYSPALQQEFVSASLVLSIGSNRLAIQRPREASSVIVNYSISQEEYRQVIPIKADGEIIPNSGVENLSDFIFYLAGMTPPKVRKSKTKEDSDLQRLSIRNLLWYCYLDQDEIDSDFFHLGTDSNTWKRLSSRDVLRFIIGFHQEKVSELEESLAELKDYRRALNTAASTLRQVLHDSSIDSYDELHFEIESLKQREVNLSITLSSLRSNIKKANNNHAADMLKMKARSIFHEIESLDIATHELREIISRELRHLNEIKMLKLKIRRDESARQALFGVSYDSCPSCLKMLPSRDPDLCSVCGQELTTGELLKQNIDILETDANGRIKELEGSINDRESQLSRLEKRHDYYLNEKKAIDTRLSTLLEQYDSAYLSSVLETEKELISLNERIKGLEKLQELPSKASQLQADSDALTPKIREMNAELKNTREQAERDTKNLQKLESIFLEMLIESKFPGIKREDSVSIRSPNFLPEVMDSHIGDLAVTSFANLSSGGKKTIFKSCFALSVHILAQESSNSILPEIIIIDSPMKNISERENKEVFESFIKLIYSLANDRLKGTQFILIDKEYLAPPKGVVFSHKSRHMQPDSKEFPPLIPYYNGH